MTNTTIPESKDQFGETLEQLRKVQAARRACFRAIQDAKYRAWEWRDRRDELRGETPAIHEQITGERQERDEINTEVQRLKRLRNEEIERARVLQEKLQILRGKLTGRDEFASLEELQQRFWELEWKQQTTSMTIEEERRLLDEMDRLAGMIKEVSKQDRDNESISEELDNSWKVVQAARDRAQDYHDQMTQLVEEAQQKHQQMLRLKENLGPSQKEIDEAHQMFVQCLQEADELRERLEVLQEQEMELQRQLDKIRTRRNQVRQQKEQQALEKLAEQAREKQQTGQKLTLEELRALMEKGSLD